MKKKMMVMLAVCLVTFCGCGNNKEITTGNEKLANAVYNDEFVSLAAYHELKAEKKNYIVTEEAVELAIDEQLEDYADYKSVDRSSKSGDNVYVNYTASTNGDLIEEEEDYYFTLGDEEYGVEFDEQLTGVSIDDQLNFSIDFDADDENENFAGKTVQFEVQICDIQEIVMPEITDKFLKNKLGFNSYKEFEQAAREAVEQEYEDESKNNLQEELLQQVIAASSVLKYTQAEYDEAKETVESFYMDYADMFGMELDSIYETLEMTEDDIEEEIQAELYRMMIVRAIIKNEKLTLSDQDYEQGIAYYMEQNDYTSQKEFVNDYGEDEIKSRLLEDKVLELLEASADITEVDAEYENI